MSSLRSAALMSFFSDVSLVDVWRVACRGYRDESAAPLEVAHATRFAAPVQPSIGKKFATPPSHIDRDGTRRSLSANLTLPHSQ